MLDDRSALFESYGNVCTIAQVPHFKIIYTRMVRSNDGRLQIVPIHELQFEEAYQFLYFYTM